MANDKPNIFTRLTRSLLASAMGQTHEGERDLYSAFGWPQQDQLNSLKYWAMAKRTIGRRVNNIFPDLAWAEDPLVYENEKEQQTQFEKDFEQIKKRQKLFHYLHRVDVLTGLGRFGILVLGLRGQDDLSLPAEPVNGPQDLIWLRPYSEASVEIKKFVTDPGDERYGLPEMYQVTTGNPYDTQATKTLQVHHSRIIHIAEGLKEDDVYGTPRLEDVYNYLLDLSKVSGGGAEMFWLGARKGLVAKTDSENQLDEETVEKLEERAQEYFHDLRRMITTQGFDIKDLGSDVADPSNHKDMLLELIAGSKGIPKRVLTGSERGELASSQDERALQSRTVEHRQNFVVPSILRPLVDRFIGLGVVKKPSNDYIAEWPQGSELNAKEQAEVAAKKAQAVKAYMSTPQAQMVYLPGEFRESIGLAAEPEEGWPKEKAGGEEDV